MIAVAFVSLGFWQLDRLQSRRVYNSTLTSRTALPTVDITTLIPDPTAPPEDAAYRRVTATGTYLVGDEVVVVGRTRNTLAGNHVVTPLQIAEGSALIVNRGWVPLEESRPPVTIAAPPSGTVTVTGVLFPTQERGRFGPRHRRDGVLKEYHRVDVPRLAQQIATPLYPLYLLIEAQDPAQPDVYPQSIEIPNLGEGPHLSYSLQWFAFALIAVAMYVAYLVNGKKKMVAAQPWPDEV